MQALTAQNVNLIFSQCLFADEESKTDFKPAKGITMNVGFHPDRLEGYRDTVVGFIKQLDPVFYDPAQGGMSFLQLPFDAQGNQWAEQRTAQELLLLASGLGMVKYCLPKQFWGALPGGVPYVFFNIEKKEEPTKETTNV